MFCFILTVYRLLDCILSRRCCQTAGVATCAEDVKRAKDEEVRQKQKEERRKQKAAAEAAAKAGKPVEKATGKAAVAAPAATPAPAVPQTPIAFLFPGQGSQAVGMLKVTLKS